MAGHHMCRGLSKEFRLFRGNSWNCIFHRASLSTGSSAINGPLHYLNGQRVHPVNSTEDIQVREPGNGQILCTMKGSSEADVNNAVTAAKQAFTDWSARSGRDRGAVLLKAARIIRENLEEIAYIESRDNGKPLWEARMDTEGCADTVEFFAGLASTIAGRHISLPNHSFGYTRREPLGVVGAIGAFNYPFQMASWKSAPALMCGNTVVFKPSPLTPLTGVMLGEIYKEAGLPDGCFNVIQGEANAGQWLSNHPDVAKMTFTGSVQTGSKVMEACAKGIKKVTLELGGKSPVIVFEDADMENAVNGTMVANFLTQGQVCSNGTRVYVHNSLIKSFLERLVEKTRKIRVGDPLDSSTQSGALVSEAQMNKVLAYVDKGKQEGAQILCGGERVTPSPELAGGYYISPCILNDVTDHMTVAREEIFGPVVCVMGFDTEEEVIQRANDTEFGLASGVFTKDLQRAHRVAGLLQAGNVYINNYNIYPPEMPFGGHKKSGIGLECGTECIDYFTQVKTTFVEGGNVWNPFE